MNVEVTSPIEQEVKKWIPNPKQERFISLPFDIFEGFFGGEKGPGKSEILVLLPILYGFHNNPNYRGLYMRRTYADIEREILDRQRKYYPSTGAVLNEQKRRWKWDNGAIDRLGHAEKEQGVREYDTDEYHCLRWDELTHFLPFQYQYLSFTRVRSSDPFLPAIVRSAGNPGNIGHQFVFNRFIKPALGGYKRIREWVQNPKTKEWKQLDRIFIPAELTDNPHIDQSYILKIQLLPEADRRAAMGDWNAFSGQVFSEWRLQPYYDEPANARHVINAFPIPSWWPKVIAIDWGWDANTCIGWGAIAPNGRVYIYRIYNERNKYIREWVRDLINYTGSDWDSVRKIKICHSAVQQRGEDESIFAQVSKALKAEQIDLQLELGKKDRIGGKLLIHEYLRWKTIPEKILRESYNEEYAEQLYKWEPDKFVEYEKFFKAEDESNLPKFQCFEETCQPLIDVIPNCIYDQKEGQNTEDVKEFKGDDPYDMIRILLESVKEYVSESKSEFDQRSKIDVVVNQLVSSGDQTEYYRSMEIVEASVQYTRPVRRKPARRR